MKAPSAVSSLLLRGSAVVAALALASCSSLPQVQVPKETKVQVPVPCVDAAKRPAAPAVAALDDLMAMDRGTRTLRAVSDLEKLRAHAAELAAVVEGCARIPAAMPAHSSGGPPMK